MWKCHRRRPDEFMKANPLNMTVGALLIVIFGLLLFLYQVRTTEVAVVTTFGRPSVVRTEPGLYAKAPWPIQKVHKLDKRIQNIESQFNETYTSDGFTLLASVYAGWSITDPAAFFPKFSGGSVENAERALEALIRSAKNEVIGRHAFGEFISTDPEKLRFAQIEAEILQKVRQQVQANNYGVEVVFLGIKRLGIPESVTQNVFERMETERQVLVSSIEQEGRREADVIRAKADSEAAQLIAQADATATRIRGEAEAEAAKSFEVFRQNPELANLLLRLTGLEMFLRDRTTLILDQNTSPLDLLTKPEATGAPAMPSPRQGSNPATQ